MARVRISSEKLNLTPRLSNRPNLVLRIGVLTTLILALIFSTALFPSAANAANAGAQGMTIDGRLFSTLSPSNESPLLDAHVVLNLRIYDPAKNCILYEEEQSVDTTGTDGRFSIQLGSAYPSAKRVSTDKHNSMTTVFQNTLPISGVCPSATTPDTYAPATGDARYVRITVTPSTAAAEVLSPDTLIDSVPNALVAESLQGLDRDHVLAIDALTTLSQTNIANIFSNTNYPLLTDLLAGTSEKYVASTVSGVTIPSVSSAPSSPATGQIWFDSSAHAFSYYNGSSVVPLTGFTLNNVYSPGTGTGYVGIGSTTPSQALDVTGNIASTGTIYGTGISSLGGPITIMPGRPANSSTDGGSVTISGGPSGTYQGYGGNVNIIGGAGQNTRTGGAINITAGASSSNANGAAVTITASNAAGSGIGGGIALQAGSATGAGAGGALTLTAGNGVNALGGAVTIKGGNATDHDFAGGAVTIAAGSANGSDQNGASVSITGGSPTGTGTRGPILLSSRVGIGTTAPTRPLHVSDASSAGINFEHLSDHTSAIFDDGDFHVESWSRKLWLNGNSNGTTLINAGGGKVGIGTDTPNYAVDISGSSSNNPMVHIGSITGGVGNKVGIILDPYTGRAGGPTSQIIAVDESSSSHLTFYTAPLGSGTTSVERMRITADGYVGIGTTTPTYALQVYGTAALSTGTAWVNASDRRLKDIHGDYEYGLDEVLKLHTVRYNYKKNNALGIPSDHPMTGIIAQEVQTIIPDAITKRPDGYLQLNIDPIHWAVVNAIKDFYLRWTQDRDQKDREIASIKAQAADQATAIELLKVEVEKQKADAATLKQLVCADHPDSIVCR